MSLERYTVFGAVWAGALVALILSIFWTWMLAPAAALIALGLLGIKDLVQERHALLRNYPVIGHMRWLFEGIRPEIRQYLIESDQDEEPFSREARSIVYQRAKGVEDKRPFGTQQRVYDSGYSWLTHSVVGCHPETWDFRVKIGGPDCKQPYDASIYNISAMSFGALSANAIAALNKGAKMGGFAHDTGEGGISCYHKANGGDLVYQVGTGYFGCRDAEGRFDREKFRETAALPQVKMIELKLSQGAKPGHGGMLPAAKITPEIAEARGVPMGVDCISPGGHSAFSTPTGMMEFLGELRELSGGKPVGFKFCVGHRRELMCMVKAMLETGIVPDFIVVDGAEGGTGAAPLEFSNHIGTPMVEGLTWVHNTLRGAGLRDRVRIGAAGKLVTAFDIARTCALGADWCNSARGFMFAIGCIQAQACHTNACPTGVATQDKLRQRALVVGDKAERVARFHENTLKAVRDMVGAAGLEDPQELGPMHFNVRQKDGAVVTGDVAYPQLPIGCLVRGDCDDPGYGDRWARARADSFARVD
ncbi:FMN-binding glutamate synthase family protein [Rhodovulum sp. DZ06]|uniref:FMN-binding glutamate synthase family protein n=1 Tax=Rhodovulum sp. DZ06 TaxID=3425126 RepID=UPI003D334A0D